MKKCTKCLIEKSSGDFYKRKNRNNGLLSECKLCTNIRAKEDYNKKYKIIKQINYKENRKQKILYSKIYAFKNKDAIILYNKKHRKENKEHYKKYARKYVADRRKVDPLFKLKNDINRRINNAFKRRKPYKNTEEILGCTIAYAMNYISMKFQPGMTWENRNYWHIDHIIPLGSAISKIELIKLCHYTNLQPLWKEEHKIKTFRDIKYIKLIKSTTYVDKTQ